MTLTYTSEFTIQREINYVSNVALREEIYMKITQYNHDEN